MSFSPINLAEIRNLTMGKLIGNKFITESILSVYINCIIFSARLKDNPWAASVAVKIEKDEPSNMALTTKAIVMQSIKNTTHFAKIIEFGSHFHYNFIVAEKLGPSLRNLALRRQPCTLSIHSLLKFAYQAIEAIQAFHQAGFIHCSINDVCNLFLNTLDNFVIGHSKQTAGNLYLVDFNSCQPFNFQNISRGSLYQRNNNNNNIFDSSMNSSQDSEDQQIRTNHQNQKEQTPEDDLMDIMQIIMKYYPRQDYETEYFSQKEQLRIPPEFILLYSAIDNYIPKQIPNYISLLQVIFRIATINNIDLSQPFEWENEIEQKSKQLYEQYNQGSQLQFNHQLSTFNLLNINPGLIKEQYNKFSLLQNQVNKIQINSSIEQIQNQQLNKLPIETPNSKSSASYSINTFNQQQKPSNQKPIFIQQGKIIQRRRASSNKIIRHNNQGLNFGFNNRLNMSPIQQNSLSLTNEGNLLLQTQFNLMQLKNSTQQYNNQQQQKDQFQLKQLQHQISPIYSPPIQLIQLNHSFQSSQNTPLIQISTNQQIQSPSQQQIQSPLIQQQQQYFNQQQQQQLLNNSQSNLHQMSHSSIPLLQTQYQLETQDHDQQKDEQTMNVQLNNNINKNIQLQLQSNNQNSDKNSIYDFSDYDENAQYHGLIVNRHISSQLSVIPSESIERSNTPIVTYRQIQQQQHPQLIDDEILNEKRLKNEQHDKIYGDQIKMDNNIQDNVDGNIFNSQDDEQMNNEGQSDVMEWIQHQEQIEEKYLQDQKTKFIQMINFLGEQSMQKSKRQQNKINQKIQYELDKAKEQEQNQQQQQQQQYQQYQQYQQQQMQQNGNLEAVTQTQQQLKQQEQHQHQQQDQEQQKNQIKLIKQNIERIKVYQTNDNQKEASYTNSNKEYNKESLFDNSSQNQSNSPINKYSPRKKSKENESCQENSSYRQNDH